MNNSSNPSDPVNVNSTENFIFAGFYSVITVLGLLANSLVIVVIKRKRKKRNANDFFILNLAIADLLFTLCIPSDIYGLIAELSYTQLFCKVFPPFSTLTFDLSVCTLTSMAIERHRVILNPLRPKMTKKMVFVWLGLIWFISCLCVLPFAIVIKSGDSYCEEDWPSFKYRQLYTASLFGLQYIFPLLVIGGCYIKIGLYLADQVKPGEGASPCSKKSRRTRSVIGKLKMRKQNVQAIKVLAAIVLVFALANLPSQIAWMLFDFGPTQYQSAAFLMMKISHILNCLHSFSNALIYGALAKNFRQEYGNILCACCILCTKNRKKAPLTRAKATKAVRKQAETTSTSPTSSVNLHLNQLEDVC